MKLKSWLPALGCAGALLLAAAPAAANQPIFRCGTATGVTYSHVPCNGARQIDASGASRAQTERHATAPQDRAKAMTRARLPEDVRQECSALDHRMADEAATLKHKGDVTPTDEKVLLQSKMRARELKC